MSLPKLGFQAPVLRHVLNRTRETHRRAAVELDFGLQPDASIGPVGAHDPVFQFGAGTRRRGRIKSSGETFTIRRRNSRQDVLPRDRLMPATKAKNAASLVGDLELHRREIDLHLPIRPQPAEESTAEPVASAFRGTETVLLVEDDEGVRSLATVLLRQLGYSVLAASEAAEAMRIVASHSGTIHLLLTDVIMPGMSGPEMAEQIRRLRPGMKALFMSGYVKDETLERVLTGYVRFLQKPFTADALSRAVRAALNPEAPEPSKRLNNAQTRAKP